ncbi:uncharacterized protein LOC121504464 [Cheilinus undulatus]|uniref:uncharacterized protein LOC121504464 n=1 Tax=Cheilinus undulatus TaxID=241271 RepID=UPI001BD576F3|nr:uncharacterized protein LOC121504464 [Cheilinus undulatus]
MSHPLYHPYATGKQSSSQGSYGLSSSQTERGPQEASCFLGPGSSLSSSGASSGNSWPMNQLSLQRNYIPEQSRSVLGEGIESSVDMHIRRIREEVRLVGSSVNHPMDQDTRFSSIQRDEFCSSGTGIVSYPKSSTSFSLGHRQNLDIQSDSRSFDLSSNYSRPTNDVSKFNMPHAFSSFKSSDDSRYGTPNERCDIKSIPGFKDYDHDVQVVHNSFVPKSGQPKYTSEAAANILMHFGLEKDDLEQLIAYPADQMTPANLPFILQQILLQKDKRATTTRKSKTLPEPQSNRPVSGVDSCNLTRTRGALMQQESTCSDGFQSSNMIGYSYTGKYPAGLGTKIGGKCNLENGGMIGSVLSMDSAARRHILESLQQNTAEWKSSALGSLSGKTNSFTSPSSLCSSALNSASFQKSDQTKQLPTQPNQALQCNLSSFPPPKKDAHIGHLNSEALKPTPLKEVDQSVLKTQQPSTQPLSIHPSGPALVNIGSNEASGTKDSHKSKRSVVVEHIFRQQGKEKEQIQQMQQTQKQKSLKQTHKQKKTWQTSEQRLQQKQMEQMQVQQTVKEEMQPASHTGQTMWPPVSSAQTLVPPVPRCSRPIVSPPVLPQPPIDLSNFSHLGLLTSVTQSSAKVAVSKPTQAMMNDYASTTTPRLFPHTCSLCNKKSKNMQAWITHHNSILHFDNCKKLRQKYPEWAAELDLESRAAAQDAKASLSTSAQTSRHKRSRCDSRSWSKSESPRRHRGSKCGRDKQRSRSRSHRHSRYHHRSPSWSRSRSRSLSHFRSCSHSRSRSFSRSRSRSRSPWYDPWISSRYRSYSSSPDRWSSPRRRDRRSSTPRRSRERRTPARRKRKRRSPTDSESSPERDRKKCAQRLAKKLLKTSGVQSLANQSDLEAVVKTLAPALVAELSKIKSSSSFSGKSQKRSSSQSGGGTRSSSNASSSSSTARKESATKTSKKKPSLKTSESDKSSSPTVVKLHGIHNTLTHSELLSAVEQFGKIKSVVMFWAKMEAVVVFENAEDAKKLRYLKYLYIDGIPLTVINGQDAVSKEEKKASQKKSVMSNASTTESTNGGAQPPSPAMYKCLTMDTKEKVVVLEAQNVSSQQKAKTLRKGNLAAKGAVVKHKTSSPFKTGTQTNVVDSKGRSTTEISKTTVKIPVAGLIEKPKVTGPAKSTAIKSKVLGSKAERVPTPVAKLSAQKAATEENVKETAEKDQHEPSESAVPDQRSKVENLKPKEREKANIPVKNNDAANVEEAVAAHEPAVTVPKGENVSYQLTAKTLKTRVLAGKRATEATVALQETKSSSSENKPKDPNQPVPKKSKSTGKEPMLALKEKPKAEEPAKGKAIQAKVFNSKAENLSINQKSQTPVVKLPVKDAPAEENVKEKNAEDPSESTKSTAPYYQSDMENLKPKQSEKETVPVTNNDHARVNEADDAHEMVTGFEGKKISEQLTARALKFEVLAAEGASEFAVLLQKTPSSSKSGFSENQRDAVGSKQLPILETSITTNKEPFVELKVKSKAEEPAKGTEVTAKMSDSKAETFSILQKPHTPVKKLPERGALTEENIQETTAKDPREPTKSAAPPCQSDVENLDTKESETKAQEFLELLEETLKPVDKVNASVENKDQTKVDKCDDADASMLRVSEATRFPSKQTVKTLKSGTLSMKGAVVKVVDKQKSSSSKSGSPENQPTAVGSKQPVSKKPIPTKEPMLELKNKPKAADQAKGTVVTAEVLDSKAKIVSTMQQCQISVDELPAQEVPTGENVREAIAKGPSEPSKSTAPYYQYDVENLMPKVSETIVQEFLVLLENTKSDVPGENKELAKVEEADDGDEPELGVSEAKNVSSQQIRSKTMAIKGAVPKEGIEQKTISSSKSGSPDSKQRPIPETSKTMSKEPVAGLKNKPKAAKHVKGTVIKAEVLNSKAGTGSVMQKPQSSVNELPAREAATKVNVQETITKDLSKATKSTAPYYKSDMEKPRHKEIETQVQESLELLEDTVKAAGVNVQETITEDLSRPVSTASMKRTDFDNPEPKEPETTGQENLVMLDDSVEAVEKVNASAENKDQVKVDDADDADEPMDLGLSEVKVVEPVDTGIFKDEGNSTNSDILRESQTPISDAVSAKDAYKASEDASTVESVSLTTQPTAAAVSEQQPPSSIVVNPLTVGEMVDKLLDPKKIECFDTKRCFGPKFLKVGQKQLLLSNLPEYDNGSYTEEDVARLLSRFGFRHADDNIFVFPHARLAFAVMPTIESAREILKAAVKQRIILKGNILSMKILKESKMNTPLGLYQQLMKLMGSGESGQENRAVFIKNISLAETQELRKAMEYFGSFKNYMPLLNKVFIELESVKDRHCFTIWFNLLKPGHGHEVHKLHAYRCVYLKMERRKRKNEKIWKRRQAIQCSDNGMPLTRGEMVEYHLLKDKINCLKQRSCLSPKFLKRSTRLMLISDLPLYINGCYTEADVANLLIPFGFQYKEDSIYVVPQARMAFFSMNNAAEMQNMMKTLKVCPVVLLGVELSLSVVAVHIEMTPFEFYKSLMGLMDYPVAADGMKTFFIRNISPNEIRDLRNAVKKTGSVRNFLPLLNKVFVEFNSIRDADMLGVWYSFLKQAPGHVVQRMRVPDTCSAGPPPTFPKAALRDKDVIEGATLSPSDSDVPQGSIAPFWVTLRNCPFVFPSVLPWFFIPKYQPIRNMGDVERAKESALPTIMLTGLPEGNYKHEDVAKLVWPYFPKQTLHSLYYNVTVLPLQRRAFISFEDWTACSSFIQDHMKKTFSVKGCLIKVHIVLQRMHPDSSEEMMYKSMMKWSNARVPKRKGLEERLLCVQICEASVAVISVVMEVVASVAPVINFLPLANRICIEMAGPSGVTKVLEAKNKLCLNTARMVVPWRKVGHFESVKTLKQRLLDSGVTLIKLEQTTVGNDGRPVDVESQLQVSVSEPFDSESQPALRTSYPDGSTISEPITPEPSPSGTSQETKKEADEKPGSCKSLKQSLHGYRETQIKFEQATISYDGKAAAVEPQTQHTLSEPFGIASQSSLQTSRLDGSVSESVTAGPSSSGTSEEALTVDDEKPQTLKSLKQSLQDSEEVQMKFKQATVSSDRNPRLVESQPHYHLSEPFGEALQNNRPDGSISVPVTAGPSSSGTSEEANKGEDEMPGSFKSLKQSLNGSGEIQIKLEQATVCVDSKPPTLESQAQHPLSVPFEDGTKPNLQTSRSDGSTIPDPIIAGPSEEAKTEEGEKQGTVKAPKPSLQDPGEMAIKSEPSFISVGRKSPAVETQTQCSFLDSFDNQSKCILKISYPDGFIISKPISAGSVSSSPSVEVKTEEVEKIGSVKSLKQDPHNSENIQVKPEHTTASVDTKPPESQTHDLTSEHWSQSALQTREPDRLTISKPIAAGPSSSGTSEKVVNESETVKGLKQSLQGSGEMQVVFEDTTFSVDSKPPAVESQAQGPPSDPFKDGSQFAVQPGGSTTSYLIYAGQSSSSKSEKPGNEVPMESTPGSKSEEKFKKLIAEEEMGLSTTSVSITDATASLAECGGSIAPAASCPYSSTTACMPEEDLEEYPQIDTEILQALTVAIRQHRLTLAARSKEKEKKVQNDLKNGVFADANLSDMRNLKKDDVITLEEIGDDGSDPNPEPHHLFPSKCSSQESRERQSPGDEKTSTSSFKDSKRPSFSSSPVSKSRIDSNSTSFSPMTFKDSYKHSKPPPSSAIADTEVCSEMEIHGSFQGQEADKSVIEETVFEIADSVKNNAVQGDIKERFSTRAKKGDVVRTNLKEAAEKPDVDDESTFQVLDSVEDDIVNEKTTITIRSNGRLREMINIDASVKGQTPLRKSQNREEIPKKEEKTPKKESTTTKKIAGVKKDLSKKVAVFEILDSVEEEALKDASRGKGKKGKPEKQVKSAKKDRARLKKSDTDMSQKAVDGEEVTYRILDFVEDESVDDLPTLDQSTNARGGIILRKIGEQELNRQSLEGSSKNKEEEESKYNIADVEDEQVQEELTATGKSNIERKGKITTYKCLVKEAEQEDIPVSYTSVTEALAVKNDIQDIIDSYSAAKSSGTSGQENISTTDIKAKETSRFKSQSCPIRLEKGTKGKSLKKEQTASICMSPDDVSDEEDYPDDTAEEEELRKRQAAAKEKQIAKKAIRSNETLNRRSSRNHRDGDGKTNDVEEGVQDSHLSLPSLVILDEFVGKETEGQTERSMPMVHSLSRKDKSANTDQSMSFVIVDKVEEVHDEDKKVLPPRRRGKAKRIRQTPVRKSTRGKTVSTKERREEGKEPTDELPTSSIEASSSLDKETAEAEAVSQVDIDIAFAVPQIRLENESLEGCAEEIGIKGKEWSPADIKDFNLLKFEPNNPLGQEFVIPKSVFFCSLCSVFYLNERIAKELHCSSQKHFNNLKKYHQKHQQKSSRSSKDSVSD